MKFKISIALALFSSVVHEIPAQAAGERKFEVFGRIDGWSHGKAHQKAEDFWFADLDNFYSGSVKSEVSTGLGVSAGALFPVGEKGFWWGGSAGYISGPTGEITSDTRVFPFSSSGYHDVDEYTTEFYRVLLEGQKRFPLSKKVDIRLGAGVGVAQGKLERRWRETLTVTAPFFPMIVQDASDVSEKWTGLAYEVGPSIAFKGKRADVEVGIVYSAFPKMSSVKGGLNEDFEQGLEEFSWNPIGVRLGVNFGPMRETGELSSPEPASDAVGGTPRFAVSVGRSGGVVVADDISSSAGGFYGMLQAFFQGRVFGRFKHSSQSGSDGDVDIDMDRTDVVVGFSARNRPVFRPFVYAGVGSLNYQESLDGESINDSASGILLGVGFEAGSQKHAFYLDYGHMPSITLFDLDASNGQLDIGYMFKWGGQ